LIKNGSKIKIFGQGKRLYDFISTNYAAEIIIKSLENNLSGIFNVGCETKTDVKEILSIIDSFHKINFEYIPETLESTGCFLNCAKLQNSLPHQSPDTRETIQNLLISEGLL